MPDIEQGDIIKVEKLPFPVLIVSKDYFNRTERAIACPVMETASPDPLHIPVSTKDCRGIVLCEQLKFLDLRIRGHKKISELEIDDIMNITDAVQGIFDYYPYG